MPLDLPVIWLLVGFNGLFLAVFVYRRIAESPQLPGALSFIAQSGFIAINCLILFPEEVSFYLDRLMRLF
jgi:hypothetical protein